MKCPFCNAADTAVVDTRINEGADAVRRRRRCQVCDKRFTTFEHAELNLPQIVKKNSTRESFERYKLHASLDLALRKRPVPTEAVDSLVASVEERLLASGEREVESQMIGEVVMRELKKLDKVAYIRYASVYRNFADMDAFFRAIQEVSPEEGAANRNEAKD